MKITLDALTVLDAIDRLGSFASAAEELHRVPSAVTYTMRKLESDLGIKLFDRTGYRSLLTPLGQELLQEGRLLLGQAQSLETNLKISAKQIPTKINIAVDGAIGFAYLQKTFQKFLKAYPSVSLVLTEEILNGCKDAIVRERADVAIYCSSKQPNNVPFQFCKLDSDPIHFVFAISPKHPLANAPEPLTYNMIKDYRIVIVPDTSQALSKASSGYIPQQFFLSVPSMNAKLIAQINGFGVGFLPLTLAEPYIKEGLLIQKRIDSPKPIKNIYILWKEEKTTPLSKAFINLFA